MSFTTDVAAPATAASLAGTVLGLEFVGSTQAIFVETGGGREFRIQKQQHEIEALDLVPGRPVRLNWDPCHTWLPRETD